ncbi:MAG: PaaI family thioesterase [Pseudomonadota bacterium]
MEARTGEPVMDAAALAAFLDEVFPQIRGELTVVSVAPMAAVMRLHVVEKHLRPGGTVSGPSMFALADCAFYAATLAMIGREALTVTTSLTINFMRKPAPADLWGEARILKLGRTLSVGDVVLTQPGLDGPVAHASVTYAIPPTSAGLK